MGLFGKKKEQERDFSLPPLEQPTSPPPPMPVDPAEVYQMAMESSRYVNMTLDKYRALINGGDQLSLSRLNQVFDAFTNLAREFEKVYELMRFDIEKLEAIQKYNEQAFQKRRELIAQLEAESTKEELPPPPMPPKLGKPPLKTS